MIRALVVICVAGVITSAGAQGRAVDRDPRDELRVLFIGNSYTRFNDLPRMVEEISRSAPSGPALDTSREARGGYDLRGHWRRRDVRERIESGHYHAVVIQGHSLAAIREPSEFIEYVRRFAQHISAAGARPILFQTWARHPRSRVYDRYELGDPHQMTARIDAMYAELARTLRVPVAPVGRAWERALTELPNVRLHREDGTHPALAGTYLSACVIYGTISGRDPRETTWRPWRISRRQSASIRAVAAESLGL